MMVSVGTPYKTGTLDPMQLGQPLHWVVGRYTCLMVVGLSFLYLPRKYQISFERKHLRGMCCWIRRTEVVGQAEGRTRRC